MHFRSILAACALIVAGLLIPSTRHGSPGWDPWIPVTA